MKHSPLGKYSYPRQSNHPLSYVQLLARQKTRSHFLWTTHGRLATAIKHLFNELSQVAYYLCPTMRPVRSRSLTLPVHRHRPHHPYHPCTMSSITAPAFASSQHSQAYSVNLSAQTLLRLQTSPQRSRASTYRQALQRAEEAWYRDAREGPGERAVHSQIHRGRHGELERGN